MDILLEKKKIKEQIDLISNEMILQHISLVVSRLSKDVNLDPHTEEGLKNRLKLSSEQFRNGLGISHEDLKLEMKKWSKSKH